MEPRRRAGIWSGILIGIVAAVVVVVLLMAIAFFAMGRCPMCGQMMDEDGSNSRMMDGVMMDGADTPR